MELTDGEHPGHAVNSWGHKQASPAICNKSHNTDVFQKPLVHLHETSFLILMYMKDKIHYWIPIKRPLKPVNWICNSNTSCWDAKPILQNIAGNLGKVNYRSGQLQQINPSFSCDIHPVMIAAFLGNLFIYPSLWKGFCRSLQLAIDLQVTNLMSVQPRVQMQSNCNWKGIRKSSVPVPD